MGTTRIKVIDLSSEQKEIKTSRKHAEKLAGVATLKEKKTKVEDTKGPKESKEPKVETTSLPSDVPSKPSLPSEPLESSVITKQSVPTATPRHRHLGQKYLKATQLIEKNKLYPAREAIDLLFKTSTVHFDPTVEIHLNVVDKNMHGSVNLPHAVSEKKEKRYLIFADKKTVAESPEKGKEALKIKSSVITKNIIWGDSQTIDEIESGKLKPQRDFDVVIAQPKFMPQLAKIAKILGPRGLMPNPKNNTVTENVASALKQAANAAFEYKSDPSAPIIHTRLGKLSYKPQQLEENLKTLIFAVGPTKIKKATISSTMSPAIKLDIASLTT